MNKDILIAIAEDDQFSLNWMSLLLVRDWRTRVVLEINDISLLESSIKDCSLPIDLLLIDLDFFNLTLQMQDLCRMIKDTGKMTRLLFISGFANSHNLSNIDYENCQGYILKDEISYSLGWSIAFANEGYFVTTPKIRQLAHKIGKILPPKTLCLSGKKLFSGLTSRESEVARLAILFSIGRRDLADELKISDQWSYGIVSELYAKLGLSDVLNGVVDPTELLGNNSTLRSHFEEIISQLGANKKAKDLETLAFHLLTSPLIEE